LQSRRGDPSVKEREHALQSLDLAYHKYREITRNLDEGFKACSYCSPFRYTHHPLQFYNDLAGILVQFKETCKNWAHLRNQEIQLVSSCSVLPLAINIRTAPSCRVLCGQYRSVMMKKIESQVTHDYHLVHTISLLWASHRSAYPLSLQVSGASRRSSYPPDQEEAK
jgi:ALIX V-shaped domain binding to HIV